MNAQHFARKNVGAMTIDETEVQAIPVFIDGLSIQLLSRVSIIMNLWTPIMELSKKTTISFSPLLYSQLVRLAGQRHSSVGELVREACRAQYSLATRDERLAVVDELAAFNLPVGTPEEMERESVPSVAPLP